MAIWQIMKAGVPLADTSVVPAINLLFDDGGLAQPGDDGFSTAAITAHLATLGAAADGFNYVGPNPSEAP
jgi:hypothetical protein